MNKTMRLVLIVAVGAVVTLVLWDRLHPGTLPEGLIQANGRMEGDTVTVASKYPGKIRQRLVTEGDQVTPGQVLVQLDDEEARAKVNQAKAALAAIEAQREAAAAGLETLKRDVPLAVAMAKEEVTARQGALQAAQEAETQMRTDRDRLTDLAARGTVENHRAEEMRVRWHGAMAELTGARAALQAAQNQWRRAQLGYDQIAVREKELRALDAQLNQVHAALDEAQAAINNLTVKAPIHGTVVAKLVEPGEVVAAGTPLLELVDLDRLYLKVYVAGKYMGQLHLGLPARIYLDAFPDEPFPAQVRYISSRAEFSPKEVQTPDERTKLVYAVKLYATENPQGRLTPGISADAVIRWKDDVSWHKPRW